MDNSIPFEDTGIVDEFEAYCGLHPSWAEHYDVCLSYFQEIYEKWQWLPDFQDAGIWYKECGWKEDEILICSDGSYTIYYLESWRGSDDNEKKIVQLIEEWCAQMSEDGVAHTW